MAALAICVLGSACELTPTEDLLSISFEAGSHSPPAEVDTLCGNGGCGQSSSELEATLTYEDDGTPAKDAVVEILQYRIDFEMGGVNELVPYYAGETSARIPLGEATSFLVRVAGDRQRDFFATRFGGGEVNGVGTLTLAGYDDLDEIVIVSASFDVAFGDFVVDTLDEPPDDGGDDGGAP